MKELDHNSIAGFVAITSSKDSAIITDSKDAHTVSKPFFQLVTELCLDAQPTGAGTIFSNEELSAFAEQIIVRAPHYIEIVCGCTNNRLGDSVGILKIRDDGTIPALAIATKIAIEA
ncbi:putative developmental regulator, ULTRAPETALA [Helianthus annuus]|nr:putative developmental regulator, ULTRAPETALA [Helianthus annuus]